MKLTPGKLAGMKNVSDKRGVIAAAAMDQRGSLQKALAKEKGGEITDAMLEEFKTIVDRSPHQACQRHPAGSGMGPAGFQATCQRFRTVAGL